MKFENLLGKRALCEARSKDYTDWAESLLYEGVDSENVAILASMGLERDPYREEIELYFQRAIKDLSLTLPSNEIALRNYARFLCEQTLAGEMDIEEGWGMLRRVGCDYEAREDPIHGIWLFMSGELDILDHLHGNQYNPEPSEYERDKIIRQIAAQTLALMDLDLPKSLFTLSICPECGHLGKSDAQHTEKPWLPDRFYKIFYRKSRIQRDVCSNCKRPYPYSMSSYEGRQQYLDRRHS